VTQQPARPSGCPVEIVAHRGASISAPENTLPAVKLAWQLDADAVEIDVQMTRDGQLAVIHDTTLKRTAGIDTNVCDLDMSELRTIDVGAWKADQWRGVTISELSEILATIPHGRRLFVELKGGDSPDTHATIASALPRYFAAASVTPESVVLISFSPALLRAAKQLLPAFDAFLVVEQVPVPSEQEPEQDESDDNAAAWKPSIAEIIDVALSSGFDGVDLSNTAAVTREAVEMIHQAQLASCIWTVNSIDDAYRLAAAGVNSLTTDDPKTIRAALSPFLRNSRAADS